ncbi:MAG: DUF3341 domain-containing protein [Gemmatimonadota bacterium]
MSGILAQYASLGEAKRAIEALRAAGHEDLDVFSPIPAPELEEALGIHSSPVRRWALIGGITGFATAYALTALTALAYPLVTQGKPIVSLPAYFIIMFELTILFAGLFGLLGLLHHTKKPARRLSPHYRKTFSVDRYGVFVAVDTAGGRTEVETIVREAGAVDVEVSE